MSVSCVTKYFFNPFFSHLRKEKPHNLCTIKRIKEDDLGDISKLYLTLRELSSLSSPGSRKLQNGVGGKKLLKDKE